MENASVRDKSTLRIHGHLSKNKRYRWEIAQSLSLPCNDAWVVSAVSAPSVRDNMENASVRD